LSGLELYGRYFLLHLSCHHLQSEQVEVEDMDMLKVEGVNMVKEHDHSSNHWLGKGGIDMVGTYMVEVMYMVEECLSNHRPEDADTDMVEEWSSNHRPEMEGMDREDIDMVEEWS
jgi:hypothetical protein